MVNSKERPDLQQRTQSPLGTPQVAPMNINKVIAWYNANGNQEYASPLFSGNGLMYPKGSAIVVSGSGLIWGGRVRDAGDTARTHVNGQYYSSGMQPGAILGIRTNNVQSTSDSTVRIYRIRPDFRKVDLRQDAIESTRKTSSTITNADINALRSAYARDWREWPWELGAPFYDTGYLNSNRQIVGANNGILDWGEDVNRNAFLDPGEDVNRNSLLDGEKPGYADADMVLWYVCNDVNSSARQRHLQALPVRVQGRCINAGVSND
jgi:hypothetical protein